MRDRSGPGHRLARGRRRAGDVGPRPRRAVAGRGTLGRVVADLGRNAGVRQTVTVMDENDPEKSGAPKPTRIGPWIWAGVLLFVIFCVYQGQHFVRTGLWNFYEYRLGTPTTAT